MMSGNVRILFHPGTPQAPLNAVVAFVSDDGTVYGETDPIPVAAGHTLSYGPAHVAVTVESKHTYDATPATSTSSTTPPAPTPTPPAGRPATPPGRR